MGGGRQVAANSSFSQDSSTRTWAQRALVLVLLLASAYLVFEFGRIKAGYDLVDAVEERAAFKAEIDGLEANIADLKQEVALLETHRSVDRESYKTVESSLMALEEKIREQQDAIAFYRGIVSPSDGNAGLRVQGLSLTRGRKERQFDVHLVLVQAMTHDRKVSGDVLLTIEGEQNGESKTLVFADLATDPSDSDWPFSFRYFQNFDRELLLPDGFNPERIKVEVRSRTRSISSIEESFAWATSLS